MGCRTVRVRRALPGDGIGDAPLSTLAVSIAGPEDLDWLLLTTEGELKGPKRCASRRNGQVTPRPNAYERQMCFAAIASLEIKRGMTQFRPPFADEALHRRPVSAANDNGEAGVEAAVLTLARLTGRQIVRKEAVRHLPCRYVILCSEKVV